MQLGIAIGIGIAIAIGFRLFFSTIEFNRRSPIAITIPMPIFIRRLKPYCVLQQSAEQLAQDVRQDTPMFVVIHFDGRIDAHGQWNRFRRAVVPMDDQRNLLPRP
jgi:hypothetical protein